MGIMVNLDEASDNITAQHSRHDRYRSLRAGIHVVPRNGPECNGYKDGTLSRSLKHWIEELRFMQCFRRGSKINIERRRPSFLEVGFYAERFKIW